MFSTPLFIASKKISCGLEPHWLCAEIPQGFLSPFHYLMLTWKCWTQQLWKNGHAVLFLTPWGPKEIYTVLSSPHLHLICRCRRWGWKSLSQTCSSRKSVMVVWSSIVIGINTSLSPCYSSSCNGVVRYFHFKEVRTCHSLILWASWFSW